MSTESAFYFCRKYAFAKSAKRFTIEEPLGNTLSTEMAWRSNADNGRSAKVRVPPRPLLLDIIALVSVPRPLLSLELRSVLGRNVLIACHSPTSDTGRLLPYLTNSYPLPESSLFSAVEPPLGNCLHLILTKWGLLPS